MSMTYSSCGVLCTNQNHGQYWYHSGDRRECPNAYDPVVLENSNVAKLASAQYLLVHSLSQEDRYDTDDASAREIYPILVPESTMYMVQSSRRREHRASVVDRDAQAHRTTALYGMRPGVSE